MRLSAPANQYGSRPLAMSLHCRQPHTDSASLPRDRVADKSLVRPTSATPATDQPRNSQGSDTPPPNDGLYWTRSSREGKRAK